MDEKKTANITIECLASQATISKVELRQKSAFALQHLMAAARFSRLCGEVQERNKNKQLGPFYDEQIAYVSATIMLCVASIESNINEYLSEPTILFPELNSNAQNELCSLIGSLSIIDKYQKVLSSKGIEIFGRGKQPLQDIEVIISLRNELIHFHPEWHDEQERHEKLGNKLRGKFELSPFITEHSGVLFPQRIISHGCTKWAVQKTIEFLDEFCFKIGMDSKLDNLRGYLHA